MILIYSFGGIETRDWGLGNLKQYFFTAEGGHSQALHRSAFLGGRSVRRVAAPLQGRERVT